MNDVLIRGVKIILLLFLVYIVVGVIGTCYTYYLLAKVIATASSESLSQFVGCSGSHRKIVRCMMNSDGSFWSVVGFVFRYPITLLQNILLFISK
ncbi:hypothetical protein D8B45_01110 [Candidatus Gracilibacteria bacterium]|nr:MAG: hypothetical protein D8B45_01110 [Candidatus Gracilibacteria bacterium]